MFKQITLHEYLSLILLEDIGSGDVTTDHLIPETAMGKGIIITKQAGVISGLKIIPQLIHIVSPNLKFEPKSRDGQRVASGSTLAILRGSLRHLLTLERTILNLLQHLSGVATLTRCYVDKVKDLPVQILDTRKTIPGLRILEKQAVLDGGGANHRAGLYDMVLVKDNHIAAKKGQSFEKPIQVMRTQIPRAMKIELEIASISQLNEALRCPVDILLLDNFTLEQTRSAVKQIRAANPKMLIESSGNISLETVRSYAQTGVDRISVGAITHSAPALDISMDLEKHR